MSMGVTPAGMEVAIISDSHIPSRASHIPEPFEQRIRDADHVIHAGDFDSEGALSNVRSMSRHLTAVAGNMDPRVGLPEVATLSLEGVEFVITHGTGPSRGYEGRIAEAVREHATGEDAVGVGGHTHEVLRTDYDGIRLLNPGSVTGASPASRATMMTATVDDGTLDVEVHQR